MDNETYAKGATGQETSSLPQPADKNPFPADDGLDQEIQRALAQHDLAQQLHGREEDNAQGHVLGPDMEKLELHMIASELKRAAGPQSDTNRESNNLNTNRGVSTNIESTRGAASANIDSTLDANINASMGAVAANIGATIGATIDGMQLDIEAKRERAPTYIPPDSELLATNSALAAYNALASQVPAALIANAHLAAVPLPVVAPSYLPARIQLLVHTLPVLDNLATQLLRIFAAGPYQTIIDVASTADTPAGAAFRDLISLFEFTKRLYSEDEPFLTVEHIAPGMWRQGERTPGVFRNREMTIELTLRKVNLATFLTATLGAAEVGFFYLNESFLDVFCPANSLDPQAGMCYVSLGTTLQSGATTVVGDRIGRMLKPQALLYLDLKTQAYISAVEAGERTREEILDDIFPAALGEHLVARRGAKTLLPTEADFVARCMLRRDTLLKYPPGAALAEDYDWFDFLRELFDYVGKNMAFLVWGKKPKRTEDPDSAGHTNAATNTNVSASMHAGHDNSIKQGHNVDVAAGSGSGSRSEVTSTVVGSGSGAGSIPVTGPDSRPLAGPMPVAVPSVPPINESISSGVSGASSSTHGTISATTTPQDIAEVNALLPSEIQEQQILTRMNPQVQGRMANRRPWSREEEKALRHALELKGTQWLTILELFGQGGRINESLKNRTQVQLKDKARNWKMFFLKLGLPVPAYLQKVTGDLDRDDKVRAKQARTSKTAAAPVPAVGSDGDHKRRKRQGRGAI